jgi:hypothetical protein
MKLSEELEKTVHAVRVPTSYLILETQEVWEKW